MTEWAAVDAIRRYAEAHGETLGKYRDFNEAIKDHDSTFVVRWDNGHIVYFNANGSLAPPAEIQWLQHLTLLDLFYFTGSLSWIGKLSGVQLLWLQVLWDQLPETWASASTLTQVMLLYPENGTVRHIPEGLRGLPNLCEIAIRSALGTDPIELPDWDWTRDFPYLETLDLRHCKLKSIPYSLVRSGLPFETKNVPSNTKGILLRGATLEEGDLSLFEQPREVIEDYYRKHGKIKLIKECKVIFLGDGEAGKSSLIERILYDTFDVNKPPTDGVNISLWNPYKNGPDKDLRLRIMDFGGQEIMHSMHRCFLTSHTVYVVACASRNDGDIDREAARWLETVRTYAPDCPVILTLSKADLSERASVNEAVLRERNPNLVCVLRTSARYPEKGNGVRALVKTILAQVPGCMQTMNANADLLGLKQDLEDMKEDYIPSEQYQALCRKHHYEESRLQREHLDWFKALGVAYYYEETKGDFNANRVLKSLRVLNPAWLTNGIYRLILRTPDQGADSGFLDHQLIEDTLKAADPRDINPQKLYTPEEVGYILYVMRMFEISHYMGGGKEMIPMMMVKTPPKRWEDFPRTDALHLRWEAAYLPNNLVHKLMIRQYDDLDKTCVWRTGGWFRRGDAQALASMDEKGLDLYVTAEQDRRIYMEILRGKIQTILGDLNIQAEEVICCQKNGREGRISYQFAMEQYSWGMERIAVPNYGRVAFWELMGEFYLHPQKEVETYMENKSIFHIQNANIVQADRVNLRDIVAGAASADWSDPAAAEKIAGALGKKETLDQKTLEKLVPALRAVADNPQVNFGVRQKLDTILKSVEGQPEQTVWEKLRPFLSDGSNLTNILAHVVKAAGSLAPFFAGLAAAGVVG